MGAPQGVKLAMRLRAIASIVTCHDGPCKELQHHGDVEQAGAADGSISMGHVESHATHAHVWLCTHAS